jgi:hypothetical protein
VAGITCCSTLIRWIDFFALHNPEQDFWTVKEVEGEKLGDRYILKGRAPTGRGGKLRWFSGVWGSARYSKLFNENQQNISLTGSQANWMEYTSN